ncbi:hypothetical protein DPMN_065879 [Dreissena polymorpha]|uniref:Uncharacterized protein n=1 Tax=Dreissena polymorpha TaxID=45954 RepID=A0A9D3YUC8_DREPO|nr:hypothetical protein DPMN_065879 [Dreissena polymorpha]
MNHTDQTIRTIQTRRYGPYRLDDTDDTIFTFVYDFRDDTKHTDQTIRTKQTRRYGPFRPDDTDHADQTIRTTDDTIWTRVYGPHLHV